jgi:serine/threonine-protein kinase GIN4
MLTPPAPVQTRNRPAIPPLVELFSDNAPPPTSPKSPPVRVRYSNEISDPSGIFVSFDGNNGTAARRPLGASRRPLSAVSQNLPLAPTEPRTVPKNKGRNVANRKGGVLKDLTGLNSLYEGRPAMVLKEKPKSSPKGKAKENQAVVSGKEQDSVRKRVIEWEKERERLREMQRLEEFASERDDEQGDVSFTTTSLHETEENIQVAKVAVRTPAQIVPIAPSFIGMQFFC